MKQLVTMFSVVVTFFGVNVAFALTGDLNGNGVIDHGNTGEVGLVSEGLSCAAGLNYWTFDANTKKTHTIYGDVPFSQGNNYPSSAYKYKCWNASCVGNNQYFPWPRNQAGGVMGCCYGYTPVDTVPYEIETKKCVPL